MRSFKSSELRPISEKKCDVVFDKPTYIVKHDMGMLIIERNNHIHNGEVIYINNPHYLECVLISNQEILFVFNKDNCKCVLY